MSSQGSSFPRASRCANCGETFAPGVIRCPRDGTLLGERSDPLVGAVLAGRYRLVARLGRGGMSTVYLARHMVIDRLAAVKVLRRDLAVDPAHRSRFLQEARAINHIHHENIVDVTDYGETSDGVVYMVMEYLPGESLLAARGGGALPVLRALDITRQIAAGLGRAHQLRVIHRDLKPDNVILVPRARGGDLVKLLDFGIAKVLDAPALTLNHRVFGTPGYIAPEYATGAGLSTAADLYALGVVLYEMVTGTLPFDARHPGELLLRTATEPPIPPTVRVPQLPRAVEAIILRCLQKDPKARHRDAFHLIDEIDRVTEALRGDPAASAAPSRPPGARGALHVPGVGDAGEAPTRIRTAIHEDDARRMPVPTALAEPPPVALDRSRGGVLDLRCPGEVSTLRLAGAWREFIEALRPRVGAHYWSGAPPEVAGALEALEREVIEMREASDRAELAGVRLLGLEARGRDFRLTIGHAMDALAADLSARARERDTVASRRDALEAAKALTPGDESAVWSLAAAEQLLGEVVQACEDIEYQRATLQSQVDRLNAALEEEQRVTTLELTATLDLVRRLDAALRDRIEALDQWLTRDAGDAPASRRTDTQHG